MKQTYKELEMEVIVFDTEDVIATSTRTKTRDPSTRISETQLSRGQTAWTVCPYFFRRTVRGSSRLQ